jgi:hypothetical protein
MKKLSVVVDKGGAGGCGIQQPLFILGLNFNLNFLNKQSHLRAILGAFGEQSLVLRRALDPHPHGQLEILIGVGKGSFGQFELGLKRAAKGGWLWHFILRQSRLTAAASRKSLRNILFATGLRSTFSR